MKPRLTMILGASALAVTVASTALGGPLLAQEPPSPIAVEVLTPRGEFTDDIDARFKITLDGRRNRATTINMRDPSRTVVAKITVQPGAHFPWHTHAGPVVVNVAEGSLYYVRADDCIQRPYESGTVFIDPGRGNVHTAFNPSENEVTVLFATFFEVPAEGPLTITEGVEPPDDCPIAVGAHGSH